MNSEQEKQLTEWYGLHVWWLHRLFLTQTLDTRCRQCTLPSKLSPLHNGICEICRSGPKPIGPNSDEKRRMSAEIDRLLKKYDGDTKFQYHCLILVSGGKDSTYLVYQLQKRYPWLRILALTVDNSFLTDVALTNVDRVIFTLRVPAIKLRPEPAFYEKVFRHAFLNLNDRLSAAVVDQCDGDILHDLGRNTAARFGIPIVMSGIQAIQVEQYLDIHTYESERSSEFLPRTQMAGFPLDSFLEPWEKSYLWDGTKWPKKSVPHMLYPFYAWEYREQDVITTMTTLGLLRHGNTSPLATNHKLIPLMGAVDVTRFGYSSYDPEMAILVRSGLADKKYWQMILEMQEYAMKKNKFVKTSVNEALERLSLTRANLGLSV